MGKKKNARAKARRLKIAENTSISYVAENVDLDCVANENEMYVLPDDATEEESRLFQEQMRNRAESNGASQVFFRGKVLQPFFSASIMGGFVQRAEWDGTKTHDFHAWCVDKDGNIYDYPEEQLREGIYQSGEMVRSEWSSELVNKALPDIQKRAASMYCATKTHDELMRMIDNHSFPRNECFARASTIFNSNPDKYRYRIIISSLGFVTPYGKVFWEYG